MKQSFKFEILVQICQTTITNHANMEFIVFCFILCYFEISVLTKVIRVSKSMEG